MVKPDASLKRGAGDTVVVACKLPHGLWLQVDQFAEKRVPDGTTGRYVMEQVTVPKGDRVLVNGPAAPQGMHPRCEMASGFALTLNVPADLWDEWLEQNKGQDYVKNNLIHAESSIDRARDWCREHRSQLSGLERLDMRTKKTVRGPDGEERKVLADPRAAGWANPLRNLNISKFTTGAEDAA